MNNSHNLDIFRALAVLLVLFDHTLLSLGINRLAGVDVNWIGRTGVLFFFVHTSLVLMLSLERDRRTVGFYVRRWFRIYPLSIVFVGLSLLIPVGQPLTSFEVGANLLLAQNLLYANNAFGPLWSLPLEVQMYVALPLLFWIARRRPWSLGFVWVASLAMMFMYPMISERFSVFLFAPCFVAGVISYAIRNRVTRMFPASMWPVMILSIAALFVSVASWHRAFIPCLALGIAIPFFKESQHRVLNRIAATVAKYSYGIYLGHAFCIWFSISYLSHHSIATRALAYVLTNTIVPVLAFYLIENPGIQLGKRLILRTASLEQELLEQRECRC